MKARLTGDNKRIDGKMSFTPGNSGSPTLYIHGGVLVASGLFNTSYNDRHGNPSLNKSPFIIGFPMIGSHLNKKYAASFNEVREAHKLGRCK
jgi:hypothetical protein